MSSSLSPVSDTVPELKHDDQSHNLALDTLRGIAILGLLVISIREFGGFTNNQQNFFGLGPHGGNYKLAYIISFLFEGKMTALLAMVFGAGMLVFMQKKEYPAPLAAPDAFIICLLAHAYQRIIDSRYPLLTGLLRQTILELCRRPG